MSKRVKQYLMLLAALGVVAVALGGGSGTFASFNAEVTNGGNYFKTGTLFLHDTAGGVTCSSESASNNNNNGTGDTCGTVFAVDPADAGATAKTSYAVDLVNAGSLASSAVQFYGSCDPDIANFVTTGLTFSNVGAGATATSIATSGTLNYGLPVGTKLKIGTSVAELTTATSSVAVNSSSPTITINSADTTAYTDGDPISAGIQFGGGSNMCSGIKAEIGTVSTSGQDYTNGSYTCIWGCSGTTTLDDLNTLTASAMATLTGTAMAANGQTHLIVTLTPPSLATPDNTYQNQKATVSLTWHIDQA
jgi:predicted ribosomally synthesized peptide with SipW-like signal peptide